MTAEAPRVNPSMKEDSYPTHIPQPGHLPSPSDQQILSVHEVTLGNYGVKSRSSSRGH